MKIFSQKLLSCYGYNIYEIKEAGPFHEQFYPRKFGASYKTHSWCQVSTITPACILLYKGSGVSCNRIDMQLGADPEFLKGVLAELKFCNK